MIAIGPMHTHVLSIEPGNAGLNPMRVNARLCTAVSS